MNAAIVTPWFGDDLTGGAERIAWEASHGLASRGHRIEILTTCSRSFQDNWSSNFYRPGESAANGVTVRRFRLDRVNTGRFAQVNRRLLEMRRSRLHPGCSPINARDERIFRDDNLNSRDLLAYLDVHGAEYDAVLFLPYLYGPILNGWQSVAEKALVQPCLHDEPYAYLPAVGQMMRGAARLLFNSTGEFEIAKHLYGPGIIARSIVVGSGIAWPKPTQDRSAHVTGFSPESEQYVLYLGRRDTEKNVTLLAHAFGKFRELASDSRLKLVLAGPGRSQRHDESLGIVDLGVVDEPFKERLLAHCRALLQPSLNESYSRTVMEAWALGRPVVVNGDCVATSLPVRETHGGWTAIATEEWQQVFVMIDRMTDRELHAIGSLGTPYAQQYASWENVLDRYEAIVSSLHSHTPHMEPRSAAKSIFQVIEAMHYGDGRSLLARSLHDEFLAQGCHSRIFAHDIDPECANDAEVLTDSGIDACDTLVVHHSDNSDILNDAGQRCTSKVLFYTGSSPQSARDLASRWNEHGFDAAWTVSAYAQGLLRDAGIPARHLALPVYSERWNCAPDEALMDGLADGRTNILFVGSISRRNRQIELLEIFSHYLTFDFSARLILSGQHIEGDPYYTELLECIDRSGISQRILVPGLVSDPTLAAFYRNAHLFCSLRDEDPFGLALIEAMWFDVPICAFDSGAAAEMLADAGILLDDVSNPLLVAGLWRVIVTDRALREQLITGQRRRRTNFSREQFAKSIRDLSTNLLHAAT